VNLIDPRSNSRFAALMKRVEDLERQVAEARAAAAPASARCAAGERC
jgi:hypothetical protein